MYDSPFEYCPACKQHVALDQSVAECARTHGCDAEHCPLAHLFAPPGTEQPAKPPPEGQRSVQPA